MVMIWKIKQKIKNTPPYGGVFLIFGNEFNFGFFDFRGRLVFLN